MEEMVCKVSFESQMPSVMSVREGERIYVVERINQDWWFVRKKITSQAGLVPAEAVVDTVSYTHYVNDSIHQLVERLPPQCECAYFHLSPLYTYLTYITLPPDPAAELTLLIKKECPTFCSLPESQIESHVGSTLNLQFSVVGSPRPYLICFKESKVIEANDRFHLYYNEDSVVTIVLDDLLPSDSGTYTIVAKNASGYTSFSLDITVQGI